MTKHDRGPWVVTRSGANFYLDDPRPEDFNISDMAAGISKDCRFGGQMAAEFDDEIYSVAQHSVYVDMLVSIMGHPEARPWAIMHDAPEGIYGDMTSPQKSITPEYVEREDRAQIAMIQRYNIPYNASIAATVHRADRMLGIMEADVLSAVSSKLWSNDLTPIMTLHELDPDFRCWRPLEARQRFLSAVRAQFDSDIN